MQERGERYRERMAGVSEAVVDKLGTVHPNEILSRSPQVEKIGTWHAALLNWISRKRAAEQS